MHTGEAAVLFLPELTGQLVRDPDGEYRPPQVAFSVDSSEPQWASPSPYENAFLAGSGEWLPVALTIPVELLRAGENTVRAELQSGEANVWTAPANGSLENDGTSAVFLYHVEVSDAPYLVWEEPAATWARLGVGQETTLTANVRPSGSGAVARSCRWTLNVDGLENQEDAAAEYVAWSADGDGSEAPSITLTGLKVAGPVPVSVTLTAEIAGQEMSVEMSVVVSDTVVPIQPGPGRTVCVPMSSGDSWPGSRLKTAPCRSAAGDRSLEHTTWLAPAWSSRSQAAVRYSTVLPLC
ncbi:MAG: hypothetical protein HDQ87_09215 [Clostridia bacterium]|nr:hypothetical protein [Clostridia bacterium]